MRTYLSITAFSNGNVIIGYPDGSYNHSTLDEHSYRVLATLITELVVGRYENEIDPSTVTLTPTRLDIGWHLSIDLRKG